MDTYSKIKAELLGINQDISLLLCDVLAIPGMQNNTFDNWKKTCEDMEKQMLKEVVHVAVVGSIKSGKSTFVNTLFTDDYLRRGAGVITSFVTKVRRGNTLGAKLVFKTWDEINAEIDQALVLLPSSNKEKQKRKFDIRRKKDREQLEQALRSLNPEMLVAKGARTVQSVILSSYLKGFQYIQQTISSDSTTVQFDKDCFDQHRSFVSDDNLSVYLKDIQLYINSGNLDQHIEIADCQGSDSSNPLHLAMIQDYLLLTHLIIYVISSRTGLREADIKFLSMIKKMGILDNILFIINVDFNEHESVADLSALAQRAQEELALIKPEPEVHTFSSLYNLFKYQNSNNYSSLKEKDRIKFNQWKKETALSEFSDLESSRFNEVFHEKLTGGRYTLLLQNHLERLALIVSDLNSWIDLNQGFLDRDADYAGLIIDQINTHNEKMKRIHAMIEDTINGAVKKIKKELKGDIDRFFGMQSGSIGDDLVCFIRTYPLVINRYENTLEVSGFSHTLYLVFQQFKQDLETFVTENISPEIIKFVKMLELRIGQHLESIDDPYDHMLHEAFDKYNIEMERIGIRHVKEKPMKIKPDDIEYIKTVSGLKLPSVLAAIRFSAKIKSEALIRLGFYTMVRLFKQILKKPVKIKNEESVFALKDSMRRIKIEMERDVVFHLKSYRENLKFQYIYTLVDASSTSCYKSLSGRFQDNSSSFLSMSQAIEKNHIDKKNVSEMLEKLKKTSLTITTRIREAKNKMNVLT
jgi:GTPase SAR1 family protein